MFNIFWLTLLYFVQTYAVFFWVKIPEKWTEIPGEWPELSGYYQCDWELVNSSGYFFSENGCFHGGMDRS